MHRVTVSNLPVKAPQTAMRAIRLKCLDCCTEYVGEYKEVEACEVDECPLWQFRFGEYPKKALRQGRNVVPTIVG